MKKTEYKTALITGASSGLGRGLALWFAKQGTKVYAAARRADQLKALQAEAPEGRVIPVVMDVADADATFAKVKAFDHESGGLDLVIANAGVGNDTYGKRINWDSLSSMLKVNVNGAAATLTGALSGMVERKRGHLVGIASLAAFRGLPRSAGYSGSKAFLSIFLEGLRVDVKHLGVRVTCVYPGFFKSEMTAKNSFKMPFMIETDDAVERTAQAIVRGTERVMYPWPTAVGAKFLASLPLPAYQSLSRKLR
ncbi:MAG: SDR family NAD(P)-dependent oxidoreductase [Myxococcaceae bacterium]|nr:SDR family NAD(P)-dependent oxidoreductase [Myxococcaceae bacterium]